MINMNRVEDEVLGEKLVKQEWKRKYEEDVNC